MSNIFTRLLLNTDKFDKGLFQAQQSLKKFSYQNKSAFQSIAKIGGYAAAFADRFHASKSLNNSSSELKVFSILFRKLQNLLRINFASLTDIFFLPLEAIVKVSRYIKAGKIRSGFSPAGKPCRKAACKFKLCT